MGRSAGAGGKPALRLKPKQNKTQRDDAQIQRLSQEYAAFDAASAANFSDFPLSQYTLTALKECGYAQPTDIQRESIVLALRGLDILGAAKTGSGKTLAFIVPILERLFVLKWSRMDGMGALVITPTRELAYQIFETLRKVGKHHDFSAGLVIGGKDLKYERDRMSTCNIVIGTPGRLLQHMDENPNFEACNLKMLVLDEADRCLDMGFADTMNAIIEYLPKDGRQTLLFSATQTRSVKDLARLSLHNPLYVSVHEHANQATPDHLSQNYIVCELSAKLDMLWSFLKSHKRKKVLVFMQSCKQVKYVSELFRRLRCPVTILGLYGSLHQLRRMAIYDEFCENQHLVLMATDIAARGLDFPAVDWVLQVDCPDSATTYLHRVGRTARNAAVGNSLLMLLPSEEDGFLKQLKAFKVPIGQIEVNPKKVVSIQRKIQAHLASDSELKASAQRAFQAYLKSVYLLKNKAVFDVFALDTKNFAASLGLAVAPRVRFLQRQLKLKEAQSSQLLQLGDDDNGKEDENEDDDTDDILVLKRKDHEIDEEPDEAAEDEALPAKSKSRVLTKVAVAKRVLKKNIQANDRIRFDDDGKAIVSQESQKVSEEGKKYEQEEQSVSGIDIPTARRVLREEDKFDKKLERQRVRERKREEKRKAKEERKRKRRQNEDKNAEDDSDDEDDKPYLDWLPDPEKLYDSSVDSEKVCQNATSSLDLHKPTPQSVSLSRQKRRRRDSTECSSREQLSMDEALALQLLRQE